MNFLEISKNNEVLRFILCIAVPFAFVIESTGKNPNDGYNLSSNKYQIK